MRTQPPDTNNPSNPLVKVAALILDKDHVDLDGKAGTRLIAHLTFKRSSDLRGHTTSPTGDPITVCFSLALRRASLQVVFESESSKEPSDNMLRFFNVAFSEPLHVSDAISDEFGVTGKIDATSYFGGSTSAAAGLSKLALGAKAEGRAKRSAASRESAKRRVARRYKRDNIAVTAAGDLLHWEINPFGSARSAGDADELVGEVFASGKGMRRKQVDACHFIWRRAGKDVLVITGSVFVMMDDLVVGNIRFLDGSGDEVALSGIAGGRSSSALPINFGSSKPKERLLKQIIRKHLVSQGMLVEGARVEICRAHV